MSVRVKNYKEAFVPLICALPVGTWYSVVASDKLELQANTQREVTAIRKSLPAAVWEKTYDEGLCWWMYDTTINGTRIHLYGCGEAPPTCTAITETRVVEERVPTAWETKTVEKEVIVGWDCTNGDGV
jgi:hypothetical protein